jgi:hypothetical protein
MLTIHDRFQIYFCELVDFLILRTIRVIFWHFYFRIRNAVAKIVNIKHFNFHHGLK